MSIDKFSPTEDEIICSHLVPKALGVSNIQAHRNIVEEKIYSLAPSSLDWSPVPHLFDHERYYFARRSNSTNDYNNNRYYCDDGAGFWNAAGDKFPIRDSNNGVLGYCRTFIFWLYKNDTMAKGLRRICKSQWVMYEYVLAQHQFQEWAFCRVKDKSKEPGTTHCRNDRHDPVQATPPQQAMPPQAGHSPDVLLQQPPLDLPDDRDHDDDADDDEEFDYEKFMLSLRRVQSQMPPQNAEDDVLIPNYQITRGLIEPPSSLIYPKSTIRRCLGKKNKP